MSRGIQVVPSGRLLFTLLYYIVNLCDNYSYKAAGANNTDEYGSLDTVEFLKCVCVVSLFPLIHRLKLAPIVCLRATHLGDRK